VKLIPFQTTLSKHNFFTLNIIAGSTNISILYIWYLLKPIGHS